MLKFLYIASCLSTPVHPPLCHEPLDKPQSTIQALDNLFPIAIVVGVLVGYVLLINAQAEDE